MRRDLDLSLLRAFLAIVETGSVTGGARLLNRTQAAVSMQLRRLEEQLETQLFARDHKRLTLTAAGEELIGHARRMLAINDELVEAMLAPASDGEVRLGLPVDLIVTYAAPILRRFGTRYPGVRVSLVAANSHDLVEELEGGRLDLAITTDVEDGGRGVERLAREDLVWITAPGGSAHRRTPLPVAIGAPSCRFRPVVLEALREAAIDWRVVLAVANQDAVNATVLAGLSVSALLRSTIPPTLEVLPPSAGLPRLPTFAINLRKPRAGATDLGEELARHVRAEFAAGAALRGDRFAEIASQSERISAPPRRDRMAG
jgi:DNA-binding transcriptional LysR family regulator